MNRLSILKELMGILEVRLKIKVEFEIQPKWILQFVLLIETIVLVVFTWGPFEDALGARPIQYFICIALDKVKMEKWPAPFLQGIPLTDLPIQLSN